MSPQQVLAGGSGNNPKVRADVLLIVLMEDLEAEVGVIAHRSSLLLRQDGLNRTQVGTNLDLIDFSVLEDDHSDFV